MLSFILVVKDKVPFLDFLELKNQSPVHRWEPFFVLRLLILFSSTSTQITLFPISAKQAAATKPT